MIRLPFGRWKTFSVSLYLFFVDISSDNDRLHEVYFFFYFSTVMDRLVLTMVLEHIEDTTAKNHRPNILELSTLYIRISTSIQMVVVVVFLLSEGWLMKLLEPTPRKSNKFSTVFDFDCDFSQAIHRPTTIQ